MSTDHISTEIEAGLKAARKLREKNEAERQRLLNEQTGADQALVDDLEATAALARAAQQRHEDQSTQYDHDLAQANRIAGVSQPPVEPAEPAPAPPTPPVAPPEPGNPPPLPQAPVPPAEPEDHIVPGMHHPDEPAAPAPAPQPNFGRRFWRRVTRVSYVQLALALLAAVLAFIIAVLLWGWVADHASGNGHWVHNSLLQFVIALMVAVGVALLLWPDQIEETVEETQVAA